jgi:hypothetical protein
MKVAAPLALPEELEVTEIEMIDDVFTIRAHSTRKSPCCPLCGTLAKRFYSHYLRRITDLPSGGKRLRLLVLVRKCFCDVRVCLKRRNEALLTKERHNHRLSPLKHICLMTEEGDFCDKTSLARSCFCCKKDFLLLPRLLSDIRLTV